MPSRAVAGGIGRKAEEEPIAELAATTATPRDARPVTAEQAGDLGTWPNANGTEGGYLTQSRI
jgi:hypothetical protein